MKEELRGNNLRTIYIHNLKLVSSSPNSEGTFEMVYALQIEGIKLSPRADLK